MIFWADTHRPQGLNLRGAMVSHPLTVAPDTSLAKASAILRRARHRPQHPHEPHEFTAARASCLLVVQQQRLVGIVYEQDLLDQWAGGECDRTRPIAQIMHSPVEHTYRSQLEIAAVPQPAYVPRHLVVLEDTTQHVVGLITWESRFAQLRQPLDQLISPKTADAEIRLLHSLAQSISAVDDFEAALQVTLKHICEFGQWCCGEVWMPTPDGTCLQLGPIYCNCTDEDTAAFNQLSQGITFASGQGLPGRIWSSRQPEWMMDVTTADASDFLRVDLAQRVGLKTGCGFPILTASGVVAVLVLFHRQERSPDREFLELIQSVTHQLSQWIQQQHIEVALHESLIINRAIIDAIPDLLIRVSRQGQHLEMLSGGELAQVLTAPAGQVPTPSTILPRPLAEQRMAALERAFTGGQPYSYEQEIELNGQPCWEEVRIIPFCDREALVMVRDISDRKRAEQALQQLNQDLELRVEMQTAALQQSESRYRAVMNEASDAILLSDTSGNLVEGNYQAALLLGYSQPQIATLHLRQIYADSALPQAWSAFQSVLQQRRATFESCIVQRQGDTVPVDISCAVINLGGKKFVLGIFRDIRDRKHIEAERQRSQRRLQELLQTQQILLREVHHRVKNNLNIIYSLLNLQAQTIDSAPLQEALRDSQRRIQSMALVHTQLYQQDNFARIRFDQYLAQLVDNLTASVNLDPQRIQTQLDLAPIELDLQTAIPLGLIVNELITNAFKHAFPGQPGGRVMLRLRAEADPQYLLQIADSGVGLPQPWTRTRSMGLRLVQILVRQLRARLAVSHEFNGQPGTCFDIRFTWQSPPKTTV